MNIASPRTRPVRRAARALRHVVATTLIIIASVLTIGGELLGQLGDWLEPAE